MINYKSGGEKLYFTHFKGKTPQSGASNENIVKHSIVKRILVFKRYI